nr:transcriptional regulatory protein sin3 [Quercus suber]
MEHHTGWLPTGAHPPPNNPEQNQAQSAARPAGGFGPAPPPQHQPQQSSPPGPAGLPPSSQPFHPLHQAHGLASLANISQHSRSPRQPQPSQRPEVAQQQQGPGFSLPGLSQATGQSIDRERAREEQIHIKEEEDRRHREQERQRMEQLPQHQGQGGPPVHLHQPVAVGPRTVHGPNGLLGNPGLSGQHQMPMGVPNSAGNIFGGGPVQPSGQPQPQNPQMQPGLLMPFGAPGAQQQSAQQQQAAQGPGQQPILNDALSYLDQVKVQFADHPDVYNRFLDIMKDFKSGAIDTPGVIGRVSTLFAGNPELIQGFNTFLPPGYRIECGAGDDPNAIRVTTPAGTTIQSMPQPLPLGRLDGPEEVRPANGTYTPQPVQSAQMIFSPSGRPVGPAAPGQPHHLSPLEAAARQQEQQAMHQQEQRGVTSLSSAVSAATGAAGMRAGISPRATPLPGQDISAIEAQAMKEGGRPPVEFNHAISYVNKIKNRFAQHPDIYKQFLEILQTYQRESKPIQDVYSQVTRLFSTAPDLLEDFKQFLPESAAHAKAAERARLQAEENVMLSDVRGTYGGSPTVPREAHIGTPSHGRGLPPVGNFAPTPVSKDNKRKRGERQGTVGSVADAAPGPANGKVPPTSTQHKRAKGPGASMARQNEAPPTSPTLIPALPRPLPPTTSMAATTEELAFFDRVKKALGNKNLMNEFLKLCNLFNQDLIDRTALIFRVRSFLGGYPDLIKFFEDFLGYTGDDQDYENMPKTNLGRVSLSNCRGLGPSYRLLPKRERQKPCSGRDELCNSVLNDEWASHPTWASEDSGFVAHRKNIHEEGLHKIEEERHDYDYNIETCARTIQLLEPHAQQLRRLSDVEQRAFALPPGLGGQSETIYKRVIMKIYGREKGQEVIDNLHRSPYLVIPILLNRLKERLESWKMAQREWEKVWREQTQKMFWRSLDHQAVIAGKNDKRQFQTKTLQGEIAAKHEEMRRQALVTPGVMKKPQMEFHFDDLSVVVDATMLVLTHVDFSLSTDQPRLASFIKEFVITLLGLDAERFNEELKTKLRGDFAVDDVADEISSGADDSASVQSRRPNGRGGNLLRTALHQQSRGGRFGRKERESSMASASRASSPDAGLLAADDEMAIDGPADKDSNSDRPINQWLDHPLGKTNQGRQVDPNEPQKRDVYRFWANSTIYCFVRMFVTLYERLCKLKHAEADASAIIANARKEKPAMELGIIDKVPADFFALDSSETYYEQMLRKFGDVLKQEADFSEVEDALRRFYLQSGYHLYAFEKIVTAISRFGITIVNGDNKERSFEIWQQFKKDRARESVTALQRTEYRKAVEKMVKDQELYRIDWDQRKVALGIYLAKRDDLYLVEELPMDADNRWRAYIASYSTVEPTDGVDTSSLANPILLRNVRLAGIDTNSTSYPPSPPLQSNEAYDSATSSVVERLVSRFAAAKAEENLILRISVDAYKPVFEPKSYETWIQPLAERQGGQSGIEEMQEDLQHHDETMREMYMSNNEAMVDLSKEEVAKRNEAFASMCGQSTLSSTSNAGPKDSAAQRQPEGEKMDVEV